MSKQTILNKIQEYHKVNDLMLLEDIVNYGVNNIYNTDFNNEDCAEIIDAAKNQIFMLEKMERKAG